MLGASTDEAGPAIRLKAFWLDAHLCERGGERTPARGNARPDRFNTGGPLETFQPNLQRVSVHKNNHCSTWLRIDCLRTCAKHDRR
jgi:hypothetical protein